MNGFLVLVRREILERKRAFAASALAALLPFLIPIVRGIRGAGAREFRESAAVALAVCFAAAIAAAIGWSSISSDLAERRMSFYFSRPLSSGAIWAGKMAGAFLLSIGCGAVVLLPSFAFSRGRMDLPGLPGWSPWAVLGGCALLALLAHAAAIALRSRSGLLALDLLCVLAAGVATLGLVRSLLLRAAVRPLVYGGIGIGAMLVAGLAAAGFASVARGRVDLRAAHRALSLRLWAALVVAVLGFAAYAGWVLSSKPRDLALIGAAPAPAGPWVAVDGEARGAKAGFLLDTSSGAFRRAGAARPSSWWQGPSFSSDGSTAAWFEAAGDPEPFELLTASLRDGRVKPRRTGYTVVTLPYNLVLSSDGTRAASLQSGSIMLVDLATGRSLGAAKLSDVDATMYGTFVGRDRFRACLWGSSRLEVLDYEIPSRRLTRLASIGDLAGWYSFSLSRDRERLLVREKGGTRLRLFDARTGRVLATLVEGEPPRSSSWPAFLADGRIVYATADSSATKFRLFSPDGAILTTIELPAAAKVFLGGEVAPGKVVAATAPADFHFEKGSILYLADLDAGSVRRVAEDLTPVTWFPMWFDAETAGSEGSKLFYGPGGSLVRFDPETGEKRVLIDGREIPRD
jgi:hypothetical protein